MPHIEVPLEDLQRTITVIEGQIKQFKATTGRRELSHNEQRTLQTMESELSAARERYQQAEDAEERRDGRPAWRFTTSRIDEINAGLHGTTVEAEREKRIKCEEVTARALAAEGLDKPLCPPARDTRKSETAPDTARRVIDDIHKRGLLPGAAATVAERLVTTGDQESRDLASRWAQATGHADYLQAFLKLMGDPQRGHMLWTENERQAYQRAEAVKKEMRGMSTAAAYGGALLPLFLDPAILLTSEGSFNPLRQIARVVTTTSNTWQGVTSAGVTAEWKTEAAEASDATPGLAEAEVPVFMGSAYVPYSFELEQDGLDFTKGLATMLVEAADQLQSVAFTTGNGTTAPAGFVTGLTDTASEVAPKVFETFDADDVYALQNALPARFQPRAQWMAALPTINAIAQFETTNGARLFPEVASGQLLRRPLNECSNMRSTDDIDAGDTADNHVLCYGDWDAFIIADRIGTTLEIVQHVVGENHRPTGQRGAYMYFRSGSKVVVPEAFRILNVATSAVS